MPKTFAIDDLLQYEGEPNFKIHKDIHGNITDVELPPQCDLISKRKNGSFLVMIEFKIGKANHFIFKK